jgi:DNA-binding NtrC family response regulator
MPAPVVEAPPVSNPMFAAQPAPVPLNGARVGVIGHGETQGYTLSFDLPLREARDAFERMYFEHHLGREGGSMTRVAEKTGLERTHLYRKLKQLGVEPGKLGKRGG